MLLRMAEERDENESSFNFGIEYVALDWKRFS